MVATCQIIKPKLIRIEIQDQDITHRTHSLSLLCFSKADTDVSHSCSSSRSSYSSIVLVYTNKRNRIDLYSHSHVSLGMRTDVPNTF